jgi:hypothetical protein
MDDAGEAGMSFYARRAEIDDIGEAADAASPWT